MQADFMKMPFPDNSFDAVYAIEATCHAPDAVSGSFPSSIFESKNFSFLQINSEKPEATHSCFSFRIDSGFRINSREISKTCNYSNSLFINLCPSC